MDASKQDDGWKSREKRQHCLYPEGVRIEDVVTGIFRVAPACLQLTESNEAVQTHAQEQNKYSLKEELYARSELKDHKLRTHFAHFAQSSKMFR